MKTQEYRLASLGVGVVLLFAAACSGSTNTPQSGGTLQFGVVVPFSGPDAGFGGLLNGGCLPAAGLINAAGGVLGNQVNCLATDTHGDPADAVPAVDKLIATTQNLVGVIGPSGDEGDSTIPLLDRVHIPMFSSDGSPLYDHSPYKNFYRVTPADDVVGYALALTALNRNLTKAAVIFGVDPGSQTNVPTVVKGYTTAGGQVVINEKITLDQSSYAVEVAKMLAAHPQVVFTEMDPQTAATFLLNEKEQSGSLIPMISTDTATFPDWFKAASGAVGADLISKNLVALAFATASSGPAFDAFAASEQTESNKNPSLNLGQYTSSPWAQAMYDSVNVMALAMILANSTDPATYSTSIRHITDGMSTSAVDVHTFAEGKTALAAKKSIRYVGVGGVIKFDKFNNSPGQFDLDTWTVGGQITRVGQVTTDELVAFEQKVGA